MAIVTRQSETDDLKNIFDCDISASYKLIGNPENLRNYWNDRYAQGYADVLEHKALIGRNGIIAEYVNRFCSKARLLDAGCGTGILSSLLDTNRVSYTGIDISDMAISFALSNRNRNGVKFMATSMEDYNPDSTFDVIVLNDVLYYLDQTYIFDQIQTWLSGQKLIITSILTLPVGEQIIQNFKTMFNVLFENKVQCAQKDLAWTIIAANIC